MLTSTFDLETILAYSTDQCMLAITCMHPAYKNLMEDLFESQSIDLNLLFWQQTAFTWLFALGIETSAISLGGGTSYRISIVALLVWALQPYWLNFKLSLSLPSLEKAVLAKQQLSCSRAVAYGQRWGEIWFSWFKHRAKCRKHHIVNECTCLSPLGCKWI